MSEYLHQKIIDLAGKAIVRSMPEILEAKKRRYASKMDYLILEDGNFDLRERAAVSIAQSAAEGAFKREVEPAPKKPKGARVQISLNGSPHFRDR